MPAAGAGTDAAGAGGKNAIQAGADLAAYDEGFKRGAAGSAGVFGDGDGGCEGVSARMISVVVVKTVG